MSDFGEPWRVGNGTYTRDDEPAYFNNPHRRSRAVACVNALACIADPAAFVERAKALMAQLERGRHVSLDQRALLDALELMTPAEIAALAAEWTE